MPAWSGVHHLDTVSVDRTSSLHVMDAEFLCNLLAVGLLSTVVVIRMTSSTLKWGPFYCDAFVWCVVPISSARRVTLERKNERNQTVLRTKLHQWSKFK